MKAPSTYKYLDYVGRLASKNARYEWLEKYLHLASHDNGFSQANIQPLEISNDADASTRVVVADFFNNEKNSMPSLIVDTTSARELVAQFESRDASIFGRLILVCCTSGISPGKLDLHINDLTQPTQIAPPVLSYARTTERLGGHPVRDHTSRLPHPDMLAHVAGQVGLPAGLLLRFLDQKKHLSYQSHSAQYLEQANSNGNTSMWRSLQICTDQGNNIIVALDQQHTNAPWTSKRFSTQSYQFANNLSDCPCKRRQHIRNRHE